ncbi:methionine--tRNA ligase, cytoplasmic [Diutina catenulata]
MAASKSVTLNGAKGNSKVTLAANLKVAIAQAVFAASSPVDWENLGKVLLTKSGETTLELVEPNAVVKYLGNDFADSAAIAFEEAAVYKALSSGQAIEVQVPFTKAEPTVEQIIFFAGVYALDPKKDDAWLKAFAELPAVAPAVAAATKATPLARVYTATNTGEQKVETGHLVKKQDDIITPKDGERNILITSALPYVNNVPHLGNIVGSVLSADIYSRYAKNRNFNVLYVCGTDEYGTATETKALEEKVTPQQLCDKYHAIHKQVYDWFGIGFDYFGRTTTPLQTEIAQDIFMKLHNNGYLETKSTEQLYCTEHKSFLADRFVEGTCPHCQYEDARGDQCDKCGQLLDPLQLINPRCKVDGATPEVRESTHVYLKLNELEAPLKEWVDEASEKGKWSKNSRTITNSWIKKGLEPRCITRDLVWGTPVPLDGFEEKVLYVWFDATIGYISITANYFKDHPDASGWLKWWQNPEKVDLYQFMGKDNVPFHTVVFPASEIGTNDPWTKLFHLSTTEYLQYEGGKFSKSRGVGVFGNNAKETGVPASVWRYYLASVRPESSDSHFSWDEFVTKNNSELLNNLGNFVNRIVKFAGAKYHGVVPEYSPSEIAGYDAFVAEVNDLLKQYIEAMDAVSLRRGLELAMAISARGNQFLQENKLDNAHFNQEPAKTDAVVAVGLNLVYLVSAIIYPFMPDTTAQIDQILNAPPLSITDTFQLVLKPGHCIGEAQYLFKRIDEKKVAEWRKMYGGQQK